MCLETGDEKTLIFHSDTAVLDARKLKILPPNPLVVVVSPLNALIADQHESCQRLKLKAVEMERELFDNDDTLNELKKCRSAFILQSGNLGKHPIQVVLFKDGQSVNWNRPFYSCVLSYLAMNASEAGVDLALIQTSLLFSCKCKLVSIRTT